MWHKCHVSITVLPYQAHANYGTWSIEFDNFLGPWILPAALHQFSMSNFSFIIPSLGIMSEENMNSLAPIVISVWGSN